MATTEPRAAARKALADYLRTQLAALTPPPVVNEGWPVPQVDLPARALTVVALPGLRPEYHQPVVHKVTPTSGANGTAQYSFGRAEVDLQLDVWAQFETDRDVLAARVEEQIHRNPANTLGTPAVPELDAAGGLVLALPDFYGVLCEYTFDPIPSVQETSPGALTADWRQTYAGTAILYLVSEQQVALMKTITANLDVGDGSAAVPIAP